MHSSPLWARGLSVLGMGLTRLARHQSWPSFVPSAPCPAQRECHSSSPQSQPLPPLSPETLISLPHQHFLCGRLGSSRHTVTQEGSVLRQHEGQAHWARPGLSLYRPLAPCRADAEVSLPEGTQYWRFPNVHNRPNDSATRGLPPPLQHASLFHPGVPRAQPWALLPSDTLSKQPSAPCLRMSPGLTLVTHLSPVYHSCELSMLPFAPGMHLLLSITTSVTQFQASILPGLYSKPLLTGLNPFFASSPCNPSLRLQST